MKILLFLAVVTTASAQQGYWEPDQLPCNCSVSGDPIVSTCDGAILLLMRAQKSLISTWDTDLLDPCKFMLRAVTRKDIDGEIGAVYVEWLGFSFDVFPGRNKKKFLGNVLMGQNLTHIYIRGHAYKPIQIKALPWTHWGNGIEVTFRTNEDKQAITARTEDCQYALDFFPRARDTRFDFYTGDYFRDNRMVGICGNGNGDPHDDYRTCPDDEHPLGQVIFDDDKFERISASCKSGKHQGQGGRGGNKI